MKELTPKDFFIYSVHPDTVCPSFVNHRQNPDYSRDLVLSIQ